MILTRSSHNQYCNRYRPSSQSSHYLHINLKLMNRCTNFPPAIWGLPGYTFMGIHKEALKLFGSSVLNYIISARTAQGYEHWKSSTQEERLDIISRWHQYKSE